MRWRSAGRGAVFAAVVVAVVMAVVVGGLQAGAAGAASGGFSDAGGVHAYGIERVAEWEIDAGCGGDRFCPSDPISRAEMAAWLYKAATRLNAPPPPVEGPGFADAPDDAWYLPYARWAAANGIIAAADGGGFDPDGAVTRAEAAVMLTAAFDHLAAADPVERVFADIGGLSEAAAGAIEGIHAAGLTRGCATGPLRYCPQRPITRGQTATMLARAIQRAEPTVGLIVNEPQAAQGYTLIVPLRTDVVHMIDHLGRRVHTWKLEGRRIHAAELLENGNLVIRHDPVDGGPRVVVEVDRDGNTVWEYAAHVYHHDMAKLPNGNVLLIRRDRLTSQEAVAAGVTPEQAGVMPEHLDPSLDSLWRYDYLQEVKPTGPQSGEVVWEWSTLDHLVQDHDPTKPGYGPIAEHPERIDINYANYSHINAIDYNPVLKQIMLSVRNFSEVWIIDHNTTTEEAAGPKGDLLYRWGNPQAHGNEGRQELFWQHDAHWIPPGLPGAGNVLIFSNGNDGRFRRPQRNYSSVEEIALPTPQDNTYPRNHDLGFAPSRILWTYTADDPADFYAPARSGVQRLPNGNTQICDSYSGTIFQVTPDGRTVWKYINPILSIGVTTQYQSRTLHQTETAPHDGNTIYRAPWYPPDYPGLKGMDLTPTGPLELYR